MSSNYDRHNDPVSMSSAPVPPGPPGHFIVGNLPDLTGDQLHQFLQLRNRYGDVVRLTIGALTLHLVSHPDGVQHVLQSNNKNYTKGRALEKTHPVLGEGLLTSEGDFWLRQRRLAQPAFHRRRLGNFVPTMTQSTDEMLQRWARLAPGETLNVAAEMMRLTLDIVSRTLFSTGLSPEEMDAVAQHLPFLLRETDRRIASFLDLRERLPLPVNYQYQQSLKALNAIVYRIIRERRRSDEAHDDLLGRLLAARDEDTGEGMTDKQLRDEVMTIFLAGHETTANNLAWTLYLLSLHPGIRMRVEEEAECVLSGRIPLEDDISQLTYTRQVLDESLRLMPPAWAISRQAIGPDVIGGYRIPAGSGVIISTYVVHRHPEFWNNPEGFDPERFTPERVEKRHHFAYIPFGGGPRLCIGQNFALMESTLALAMITGRYRLNLLPGPVVEPETTITLRPRNGIYMTVHPRKV